MTAPPPRIVVVPPGPIEDPPPPIHPLTRKYKSPRTDPFEKRNEGSTSSEGRRSLQRTGTAYSYADPSDYRPMRVQFDTHLLDALSSSHPSHVSYVRNVLLPSLRNFWSEAINVVPANTIEVPLSGDGARCADEIKETSGLNLDDLLQFSSPEDSSSYSSSSPSLRSIITNVGTDGSVRLDEYGSSLLYDGVDLVVVVLPVEGTAMCPDGEGGSALPEYSGTMQTLAFATNCQHDQFDRPTVGYTGICFGPLVRRRGDTCVGVGFLCFVFFSPLVSLSAVSGTEGWRGASELGFVRYMGRVSKGFFWGGEEMKADARVAPLEWVEEWIGGDVVILLPSMYSSSFSSEQ